MLLELANAAVTSSHSNINHTATTTSSDNITEQPRAHISRSGDSSSFSSPLPPCPEDLPAPPPPSCTPPKYQPLEEDEDEENGIFPPPPPLPPGAISSPSTPPPPPFSPPNTNRSVEGASGTSPDDQISLSKRVNSPIMKKQEQTQEFIEDYTQEQEDKSREAIESQDQIQQFNTTASVTANLRSIASEKEVMAIEFTRDNPIDRPRWYIGDIENYTILDKVGSGTYGEVFKCQHKITKDIVALKKLRPDVEKNGFPVTSLREMKILKFLKHPNIVALKEIVSSSTPLKENKRPPLYFAFEYMEHDLSGLLNHPRVKFSRTQIQCYMRQLLCGAAFMHRHKVLHRDIKASNLLLNNSGMLKIADFGLSRFWNEVNAKAACYTNKVVTLWYRPPELLLGSKSYDFSVDVWSIGCIFGELLLGKPILQGKTEIEQLQLIFGLCGHPTEENWPGYDKLPGATTIDWHAMEEKASKYSCLLRERFHRFPDRAVDLLERLLQLDPAKRITAREALDHDYFWRVVTCKPRDLPKFEVSSTHEYQSKKRYHEELAAAGETHERPHKRHHSSSKSHTSVSGHHPSHSNRPNNHPSYHGSRHHHRQRHDSQHYDTNRERDRTSGNHRGGEDANNETLHTDASRHDRGPK